MANKYSEITPQVRKLAEKCRQSSTIDSTLFTKYQVNRGLRDLKGNGVLTGLTEISEIQSSIMTDEGAVPCDGKLFYRGINVEDIVGGFIREKRYGFEETTYLLLFGELPTRQQLTEFQQILSDYRTLPTSFVRDIIMKAPSSDMMNTLARSVLTLYSYDENANDITTENVLRQCLQLIALFPLLSVYGYQAYSHYHDGNSLYIHNPQPNLSTAENILFILRPDSQYTELEAKILDLALVLHAEHGGGNNSTFTTHVVSSSGTDTYSVIAASLGSLKGPKHGGANIKVVRMIEDMKQTLPDWTDEDAIVGYLRRLLHKEAFDRAGLIYGMGHAVYSLSDPRANIFKNFVESLSVEKGRTNTGSTPSLKSSPPRSSRRSARSTRASAPTSTFTAGSCTACSTCRSNSTPRFLPSPVSRDGVPTGSRSSSTRARSSARPTRAWRSGGSIPPSKAADPDTDSPAGYPRGCFAPYREDRQGDGTFRPPASAGRGSSGHTGRYCPRPWSRQDRLPVHVPTQTG